MSYSIDDLGGTVAVARMARVKPPTVTAWRKRGVPAERAPYLERGTNGRHTAEVICPNVRWVRVPDPLWPHPHGRPCIDPVGPMPLGGAANDDLEVSHAA